MYVHNDRWDAWFHSGSHEQTEWCFNGAFAFFIASSFRWLVGVVLDAVMTTMWYLGPIFNSQFVGLNKMLNYISKNMEMSEVNEVSQHLLESWVLVAVN